MAGVLLASSFRFDLRGPVRSDVSAGPVRRLIVGQVLLLLQHLLLLKLGVEQAAIWVHRRGHLTKRMVGIPLGLGRVEERGRTGGESKRHVPGEGACRIRRGQRERGAGRWRCSGSPGWRVSGKSTIWRHRMWILLWKEGVGGRLRGGHAVVREVCVQDRSRIAL